MLYLFVQARIFIKKTAPHFFTKYANDLLPGIPERHL